MYCIFRQFAILQFNKIKDKMVKWYVASVRSALSEFSSHRLAQIKLSIKLRSNWRPVSFLANEFNFFSITDWPKPIMVGTFWTNVTERTNCKLTTKTRNKLKHVVWISNCWMFMKMIALLFDHYCRLWVGFDSL